MSAFPVQRFRVGPSRAQLAIAGKLYRVTLTPVTARLQSEALDAAYAQKYDMAEVFGDALPSWWYYHVSPVE
jgi:hypothetical protein